MNPDFATIMPAAQRMASYACTECGFFLPERTADALFLTADCPICLTRRRFLRPFSAAEIELMAQVAGLFGGFGNRDVAVLRQLIADHTPGDLAAGFHPVRLRENYHGEK